MRLALGCCWHRWHHLVQSLRFEPSMEAAYRAKQQSLQQRLCTIWGGVQATFMLAGIITGAALFGWTASSLVLFISSLLMFLLLFSSALAPWLFPVLRRNSSYLFFSMGVLLIAWTGWMAHLLATGLLAYTEEETLSEVWELVGSSPTARQQLQAHLCQEASERMMFVYILYDFFALDLLRMSGNLRGAAAACLALPVTFVVAFFLSGTLSHSGLAPLVAAALVAVFVFITTIYVSLLQRSQFAVDHRLQAALEAEAIALEEAKRQEERRREASQRADSTLYHILKNIMADACGCVDLFLDGSTDPVDPSLQQAVACLSRGIQWCKQRQVMVQIAAGGYTPLCVPVNLQQFGESIIQGRNVVGDFPEEEEVLLLDPTVCAIVLDNAIANAVRHGDPLDPLVRLTIRVSTPTSGCSLQSRQVTFIVTNRVHPGRPPVTPDLVERILAGDRSACKATSSLSDGVGLKHTFMAAETHGMRLSLGQVGDIVCLEASLDALPAEESLRQPTEVVSMEGRGFPEGVHLFCLEDSEVSRRILKHGLTNHTSAADVRVYGEDADDVLRFQEAALAEADVIMLDQHLDYGDVQYTGSDVLRALLDRGYRGFVCIRSADASHEDELEYKRAGAHCVIGKDVRIQETAATLQARYCRWLHRTASLQLIAPSTTLQRLAHLTASARAPPPLSPLTRLGSNVTGSALLLERTTDTLSSATMESPSLSPTSRTVLRQPPTSVPGTVPLDFTPSTVPGLDTSAHVASLSPMLANHSQHFTSVSC